MRKILVWLGIILLVVVASCIGIYRLFFKTIIYVSTGMTEKKLQTKVSKEYKEMVQLCELQYGVKVIDSDPEKLASSMQKPIHGNWMTMDECVERMYEDVNKVGANLTLPLNDSEN